LQSAAEALPGGPRKPPPRLDTCVQSSTVGRRREERADITPRARLSRGERSRERARALRQMRGV